MIHHPQEREIGLDDRLVEPVFFEEVFVFGVPYEGKVRVKNWTPESEGIPGRGTLTDDRDRSILPELGLERLPLVKRRRPLHRSTSPAAANRPEATPRVRGEPELSLPDIRARRGERFRALRIGAPDPSEQSRARFWPAARNVPPAR
jgi:hypothetical protein